MLFKITHLTAYHYSADVFLNPHILRFKPRTDAWQQLRSYEWNVYPHPAGKSARLGLDNNAEWMVWFEGQTRKLDIQVTSVVETFNSNPFQFLLYPFTSTRLPIKYSEEAHAQLQPFLSNMSAHPAVDKFAKETLLEADYQTLQFVTYLTQKIHKNHKTEKRETGPPLKPEQTLSLSKGTCRDLAVLQMAVCRKVGIASRFVSGYYFDQPAETRIKAELHAWLEVFLPGGGWRGFDPTTGLAVTDHHIAVASSADPVLCAPVKGSFHGHANASMTTEVMLEKL